MAPAANGLPGYTDGHAYDRDVDVSSRATAVLLPSRPPARAPWGGPRRAPGGSARAAVPVRAVCCSGGGIRSAAFSLGGIQRLGTETERAGTLYEGVDLVTSVSGGGYTTGSYAIVKHSLGDDGLPVYAPGSPEDNRLRAHTRYLVDSKTQLAISVLGIVYGLLMNLVAILALAYVVSTLVGAMIGTRGLRVLRLTDDGRSWATRYPDYLVVGIGTGLALGAVIYFAYRTWDTYSPLGEIGTKRWTVTAIAVLSVAVLAAGLLLGIPWVLQTLSHAHGKVAQVQGRVQTTTFLGTVAAVVAIVQRVVRAYKPVAANGTVSSIEAKAKPWLVRAVDAALPWLGSVLLVLLLVAAMLSWVSDMALGSRQGEHWTIAASCVVVLLLWQTFTDPNQTSLHRYYTQRLATAFARTRAGEPQEPPTRPMSAFGTDVDRPRLVICAAVNTDQPGGTPSGRRCAPFTFSAFHSGISSGTMFGDDPSESSFDLDARESGGVDRRAWNKAYRRAHGPASLSVPTVEIERRSGSLDLIDMVAVSAAAVAPAMGRMTRPSVRLLLGVANVRLGMWLPNPLHAALPDTGGPAWWARIRRQARQPGLIALAREIVGGLSLHGHWVYVTDGGHYENLGLVEALRRGATELFVFDASGDEPLTLRTLGQAIETARTDLGVEIAIDVGDLTTSATPGYAKRLAAHGTATYANGVVADIYFCKAAMTAGLSFDIESWRGANPNFPNNSTADQLYGDQEFEVYRALGFEAADQAGQLWRAHHPQTAEPAVRAARTPPR